MAVGIMTRREVLDALSRLAVAALGQAVEVGRIDVRQAPTGIQHRGFSFAKFDSEPFEGRGRRGEAVGTNAVVQPYAVVIRFAFRTGVATQNEDRRKAGDALDKMQRALGDSTSPDVAKMSVTRFSVTEQSITYGQWLVYDVSVRVLTLFDLALEAA